MAAVLAGMAAVRSRTLAHHAFKWIIGKIHMDGIMIVMQKAYFKQKEEKLRKEAERTHTQSGQTE